MDINVGSTDRLVRIVIGLIAAVAGIVVVAGIVETSPVIGAIALVVGVVLLATGATQKCPFYQGIGVSTSK
ncbi:MAG: DUF2892 domain-containing protein [Haloarculaceae archaeon]